MDKFEETKIRIYLHKFLILVAIFGGINYASMGIFKYNLIEELEKYLKIENLKKIIYIIIGISGFLLFERDNFLPFLGHSVYPCEPLKESYPENSNIKIKIRTEANKNIIFWASEPNNKILDNPYDAYLDYKNSGVTRSDENGIAILKVRKPSNYYVPMKPEPLRKHIHYRICNGNGMLSRIETIYLE